MMQFKTWALPIISEIILWLIILVTLIISCLKRKNIPSLWLLPYYLFSFLLLIAQEYVELIFWGNKTSSLVHNLEMTGEVIVLILEFLTFGIYLYNLFTKKPFKKIVKLITLTTPVLFISLFLNIAISTNKIYMNDILFLNIIESFILILFCLFYFIELFKTPSPTKLSRSKDFWICSGLMIYLTGTLPVTIINKYFFIKDRPLYINSFTLIYFFYALFFLAIIRSYFLSSQSMDSK